MWLLTEQGIVRFYAYVIVDNLRVKTAMLVHNRLAACFFVGFGRERQCVKIGVWPISENSKRRLAQLGYRFVIRKGIKL